MKMDFILVNVPLGKAILFFISVSHLPTGVIVKPKYLKVFKGAYLFYSFPGTKNVTYRNV